MTPTISGLDLWWPALRYLAYKLNDLQTPKGPRKNVARGGSRGSRDLPFCKLFLTKEPTLGGENAMTISWP